MARAAATEEDVQQKLAVDAFLDAIPWKVVKEVKKKKLDTLKKALEEAKFIMVMNEEEDRKKNLIMDEVQVQKLDEEPPRRNGQVSKPVDGWKRDEPWNRPPWGGNRGRDRGLRRSLGPGPTCWACERIGHMARNCPLWIEWRRERAQRNQENGEMAVVALN